MNKRTGISLITLVITIVVIVILTGAIVLSISNNNPIKQASEATFRNDLTTMKEQYTIEYAAALGKYKGNGNEIKISDFSNNIIPAKYAENLQLTVSGIMIKENNTFTEEELKIVKEILGDISGEVFDGVKIPEGFYYVGGTKETGIVISDNSADENKGDSYEVAKTLVGNQYVWIPIASEAEFVRKEWKKGNALSNSTEPYASGYSTEVAEYNEMKAKVVANQGFYIARYEASNNGGTAESKALKTPWNSIKWNSDKAMNTEPTEGTASYEGRHASDKLGYTSVQSTLIYGVEWDNALKYIENTGTSVIDSTSWGNHNNATFDYTNVDKSTATKAVSTNTLIPTGGTERHMKQNISDMAGNVGEWTMEANSSTYRSYRGGEYVNNGTSYPAAYRSVVNPTYSHTYLGFRVALYVK